MQSYLEQIIFNIIGGAIVSFLTWLFFKLRNKYFAWNFRKVFGCDAINNFYIVYGEMKIRPGLDKWPYYKPGTDSFFNVSTIVSLTSTKSAKYLSETFGMVVGDAPKLVSDNDIKEKLDISFCSIGGLNNFKTIDVLGSRENEFYKFDKLTDGSIGIVAINDKTNNFSIKDNYDYAFIIKIRPRSFPNRTWIVVAGLGEWGTSGAVWFLSKKWKELPKNKSFGAIIRVKGGQDESAELVDKIVK